ncbi:MAG: tripartite-type tricarboxylate transporter receptor subunit TctC [Saprospiraceae bacterium]|jgi:tripartite-type tricarboxylate transporter receptor subunit TctC
MTKHQLIQILGLSILFFGLFSLLSFYQKGDDATSFKTDEAGVTSTDYENYFEGKTIEWIIPFKEGGGADTWARYNAPFLSKHIKGNPVIIISNIPGGGSIKGANLFAERVKPDGTMILGTSGTTQMPFLLDDPRVRYDYTNYKPIMAYPNGGVVYCSPSLGINSAADISNIFDKPLKYASQGPTSLDIVPMFSFELLGLDVQAVFGFRGRGAGRLAFERGEVMLDYQTSSAYLKNVLPLVANGEAIPLFSFGALDEEGNLIRDPSFPDLPHFGEVYEQIGNERVGVKWDAWFAFMSAGFGGMKLLLTPNETPDEIVRLFQDAILRMKQDPNYQKSKITALGEYEQSIGQTALRIFDLATNVNEAEKEYMKEWLRQKYKLNI